MSSRVNDGGATGPWIGSLLRRAWQRVRDRIYQGVAAAGYDTLSRAHVGLFRFESPEGWRPGQLADHMSITKQSVNDLLRELERLGYLELRPDPHDRRARRVRLTAQGRRLDAVVRNEARAAERELVEALGAARFNALRQALLDLLPPGPPLDGAAVEPRPSDGRTRRDRNRRPGRRRMMARTPAARKPGVRSKSA